MRKRVVEHVTVGFENISIWPRDIISSFVAVDDGKVKWAVNECILMCQIKPFTKRGVVYTKQHIHPMTQKGKQGVCLSKIMVM